MKIIQIRNLYPFILLAAIVVSGCRKILTEEESSGSKKKAEEFQASIGAKKYRPVSFYSDRPIDYITDDSVVKAETDLWGYVKEYIKDDENYFGDNGKLTINQMALKHPGISAGTIDATYGIVAKGSSVMFNFVDYEYTQRQYKLEQFDDAYFTVYVDGPAGSKLYSKYARVQ